MPKHLEGLDALIIPGGESTTLSRLMSIYELREPVKEMARQGKAIWGTCAGMIMMAGEITEEDPLPLELMDIGVYRNAFGRQIDSFEQSLKVSEFDSYPFHAIFIRAPVIVRVGEGVKSAGLPSRRQTRRGSAGEIAGHLLPSRVKRRHSVPPLFPGPHSQRDPGTSGMMEPFRISDALRCSLLNSPRGPNLACPSVGSGSLWLRQNATLWHQALTQRQDRIMLGWWDGLPLGGSHLGPHPRRLSCLGGGPLISTSDGAGFAFRPQRKCPHIRWKFPRASGAFNPDGRMPFCRAHFSASAYG